MTQCSPVMIKSGPVANSKSQWRLLWCEVTDGNLGSGVRFIPGNKTISLLSIEIFRLKSFEAFIMAQNWWINVWIACSEKKTIFQKLARPSSACEGSGWKVAWPLISLHCSFERACLLCSGPTPLQSFSWQHYFTFRLSALFFSHALSVSHSLNQWF